ncbi:MAG: phosphoribosylamine--glycine ligase [Bacteroidetes bacterium CG18_big_fil_WC_8_21_14_2_50_41_14]|nr:MAG: phosphoribosylamine--glycine ligase [Bacteroidetes bacterium CG18_big_fil_WC_8_21_14_2_50_41_14]PJB58390.1 MAG: phosphoribosylamine--glycine ligase [Bacteroidetes bacterium CG_4_9_14_3_um_filter_41_19]
MNTLILGSGGREHALAWKIAQSSLSEKIFIAPGNAGTRSLGTNLPIGVNDFEHIKTAVIEHDIDLVVVGPEDPLVQGIYDYFQQDKILCNTPVIGPSKAAAMLEGSKDFAKDFMFRHQIPTAAYLTVDVNNLSQGMDFLDTLSPPYVLKADGLAQGKGVLILDQLAEAKAELKSMITDAKFGDASKKVVIEEFLTGIECSVFVLTDGTDYVILPDAKDYKRIGEGNSGLNTGGMGSVSPVPFANTEFIKKVEKLIIVPTIKGLQSEGLIYKGFIFFGLIQEDGNPKVIEYNCRMGDPESESVIPRIQSDLLELFIAVGNNTLGKHKIVFDERYTATVFLVSGGYPEKFEKGKVISGLENMNNCIVFHAGTAKDIENNAIKTNGGRVLAVTSYGYSLRQALNNAYANAENIHFEGRYFRNDIGFDLGAR